MTSSITDQFKERLANEYEEGDFRGFPLRVRRMRSRAIYARGEVPMMFADAYRRAVHSDYQGELPTVTAKDCDDYAKFQMEVIVDCCLEPKLKISPDDPGDGIPLDELPDELVEFLWRYATRAANFLAAASESASDRKDEVTADLLMPFFRDGDGTAQLDNAGERRETLRPTTGDDAGTGAGNDVSAAVNAGV